jgi:hypothetical protein
MKISTALLIFLTLMALLSCCIVNINRTDKLWPEYHGVDPKAAPIVDQWLSLAKDHGIAFDNTVTIGFKDINKGLTVGLSNLRIDFREIDLDKNFWDSSSLTIRRILLYHELCHSYCYRLHDYEKFKSYPEAEELKTAPRKGPGYFEDSCPTSLMFPIVIGESCFLSHYQHYIDEMFERCDPY